VKQTKRILLIAPYGSYRTAAYLRITKQLGFDCIVGSTGYHAVSHAPGSTIINLDRGSIDLDLERLQKQHSRTPFDGVIATDDSVVEIAAGLAKRLHLPGNSVEAVRRTCRKDLLKRALLNSVVLSPKGFEVRLDRPFETQIAFASYPCVAKPLTLSASRGVIRADNPDELKVALARIWRLIQKEGEDNYPVALVERFIHGKEIAVEGLLLGGNLSTLAIFDKPIPLNGPYFEETIYVTPSALSEAEQQEVNTVLSHACQLLELRQGPVHAECRLNDEGVWIIDIASRSIGGQCSQLIKAGTGVTLEEMIVRNSVGEDTTNKVIEKAVGVMMIPVSGGGGILRRIEGLGNAVGVAGITGVELDARPGQILTPWPEGCAYPGFIFAEAKSTENVVRALERAYAELTFVYSPSLPVHVVAATSGSQQIRTDSVRQ